MKLWKRGGEGRTLVASAERIKIDKSKGVTGAVTLASWQKDAWTYYDAVPEIWFAMNYVANALRRIRLFPATQPDPMQPPVTVDDPNSGVSSAVAEQAYAELDRLRDIDGTHGSLVHDMAHQLSVPGEGYFVIYDDADSDTGEVIGVFSTDELSCTSDGRWTLRDEGRSSTLPDQNPSVSRFWRNHPRFRRRPDSPMRALCPLLSELLLLDQLYRSNARSRVSAGILLVPNEINFRSEKKPGMSPRNGQGEERDPFVDALMTAVTTPVLDEESVGNVAPGVIKCDSKFIEAFRHLTFGREFDAETASRYDKVLARVATGLDIPNQILTGIEGLNHWSAWLVDEDAFDSHLAPLTQLIVSSLTQVFLTPALGDDGDDVFVWFDPSALISHPNKAGEAKDAYDRGVISASAYRRYAGYSEDDAPENDGVPPGSEGDISETENEQIERGVPDEDESEAITEETEVTADASPFA